MAEITVIAPPAISRLPEPREVAGGGAMTSHCGLRARFQVQAASQRKVIFRKVTGACRPARSLQKQAAPEHGPPTRLSPCWIGPQPPAAGPRDTSPSSGQTGCLCFRSRRHKPASKQSAPCTYLTTTLLCTLK